MAVRHGFRGPVFSAPPDGGAAQLWLKVPRTAHYKLAKIVLDTSIVISGEILRLMGSGELEDQEIIIPEAVVDELQSQAAKKEEQGFVGLEEIKKMKKLAPDHGLQIRFEGTRPSADDVMLSGRGRIDAIIKDVAKQNDAILYTSDRVQSLVAEVEGVRIKFVRPSREASRLEFLKFFTPDTMSVHLKEGVPAKAKRGKPGAFELVKIEDRPLSREYIRDIAAQIVEISKTENSNIEISRSGALVVQYLDYRIAITQPPFSEGYEITIVHPIVKLSLDDYGVSEKLMSRFLGQAEGIIISGAPGSGKSTLASSLANFYHGKGKIVKTFESPRDLQVDPGITQYTKLDGSFENTADILLLVRPDYTVFDEVRRREDFGTFADLRMTGVGIVGVVHANSPLDAIQRFIGKIELGIIPSILDTVVFVRDGKIAIVYELELKVKVPSGMVEQDLARPVIEIRNFEDGQLEYEIYTFGEENVIVPVSKKQSKTGMEKLAEDKIREIFKRYDSGAEVEFLSDSSVRVGVAKPRIPAIIGRGGSNISELQRSLKIHIDIVEKEPSGVSGGDLPFTFSESKNAILLTVDREHSRMHADVLVDDERVTTSRIGRKGQIKIPRHSEYANRLMESKSRISVRLRDF